MISQFFILSARGDTIINRDFRCDIIKNTPEVFFRNVKMAAADAPPIFNIDGITFGYLKKSGLYLVVTSRFNVGPASIMELLLRISKFIKDYCGVLTEDAIRKNFILIYEILDEAIDFGYPQMATSDLIKNYIVSEPVILEDQKLLTISSSSIFGNTKSSTATQKSILSSKNLDKPGEIFVDILEKLIVLFNSNGYVTNSLIEGCIQMKSYLNGNPTLKLALNDDLGIGKDAKSPVKIDDYSFNDCVNFSEFEYKKAILITPPEGEFLLMSYRVTGDYMQPFRIFPIISEIGNYKLEVYLKISSQIPKDTTPSSVIVRFNVPSQVMSVHNELEEKAAPSKQKVEYLASSNIIEWKIHKFNPMTEHSLKTKITLQSNTNIAQAKKMIGPINLQFEISMFNVSNLNIKYLKIETSDMREEKNSPQKWIRYITQSTSYQYRL